MPEDNELINVIVCFRVVNKPGSYTPESRDELAKRIVDCLEESVPPIMTTKMGQKPRAHHVGCVVSLLTVKDAYYKERKLPS